MIKGYCWGRESFCRAVWKACACYLSQTQGFCWGLAFICSFPPTPMFLQHPAEAMVSSCSKPLLKTPQLLLLGSYLLFGFISGGSCSLLQGGCTVLVPPAPPALREAQPAGPAAPKDGLKNSSSTPGAALEAHRAPYEGALAFQPQGLAFGGRRGANAPWLPEPRPGLKPRGVRS